MAITINHQTNAISATAGNLTAVASGLSGGGAGQIPYNTAATTTAFVPAGTAGQVLQSNSTSAPSWTTPNTITATASGAITAGNPVVVNSNGTVSRVVTTPPGGGAAAQFNVNLTTEASTLLEIPGTNTVVISYRSSADSNFGYAQVGTLTGSTISWGTRALFNSDGYTGAFGWSMCWDSLNSRVVIAYQRSSGGTASVIVGSISGTNITFGTAVGIPSSGAYVNCCFDASTGKVVIVYGNPSGIGATAVVGTVSGTAITLGTGVAAHSDSTSGPGSLAYIADIGKIAYTWPSWGDRNYFKIGTVSGTSISFAAAIVYPASLPSYGSGVKIFYNTVTTNTILYYQIQPAPNTQYGAVLDITSDTSITFNTPTTIPSPAPGSVAFFDSLNNRYYINTGTLYYYQISGTTFPTTFTTITYATGMGTAQYPSGIYNSTINRAVCALQSFTLGSKAYAFSVTADTIYNMTATNFIGMSVATYADAATATIVTAGGVNASQTGLTPGLAYYVRLDGTVSTTPDTPSVFAGTAIAATRIIVEG